MADRYPELLDLFGCRHLARDQVQRHVAALAGTFDAAAATARTPFFFSRDISPAARAVAIDGSQALVALGDHREAMFWLVATFARCHTIFAADAPHLATAHAAPFRAAVADLGIRSADDIARRAVGLSGYLPRLWETAEAIIEDGSAAPQVAYLLAEPAWPGCDVT